MQTQIETYVKYDVLKILREELREILELYPSYDEEFVKKLLIDETQKAITIFKEYHNSDY